MFPNWKNSVYTEQNQKLRNATCTAIAPTGTISLIAGTTASIEPLFALVYRRSHTLGGDPLLEMTPLLEEYTKNLGYQKTQWMSEIFRAYRNM